MEVPYFRALKGLCLRGGKERGQKEGCIQHLLTASSSNLRQARHPDVTDTSENLGAQENIDLNLPADLATMPEEGEAYACTAGRADPKTNPDPPPALPSSLGEQEIWGTQGSCYPPQAAI